MIYYRSMVNEVKNLIVKPKRTPVIIAAGVIIGLVVIGLIVFGYRKFAPATLSTKRPVSHELDTCAVTKEGNPLVESLSTQSKTIQGKYKGKITDLAIDSIRKSFVIKLTSLDNQQSYSFNIRDQKGVFFGKNGEASGSALKTTQTLQISFTCSKDTKLLNFTKVLIQ